MGALIPNTGTGGCKGNLGALVPKKGWNKLARGLGLGLHISTKKTSSRKEKRGKNSTNRMQLRQKPENKNRGGEQFTRRGSRNQGWQGENQPKTCALAQRSSKKGVVGHSSWVGQPRGKRGGILDKKSNVLCSGNERMLWGQQMQAGWWKITVSPQWQQLVPRGVQNISNGQRGGSSRGALFSCDLKQAQVMKWKQSIRVGRAPYQVCS